VKKFLIGFAAGLIVVPLAIYVYFAFGMASVATAAPEMPFERLLAKKALRVRREREMPRSVPIATDESNYAAGAHIYREHCAVCHGLPKQPQTAIAKGMYPKPPALLEGKGVTDDPAGETYWKVAGGIRMTGMPGFQQTLSSTEIWQVGILLAHADHLPQKAEDILSQSGSGINVK
jgi:mono/diheme cytochrome c family protein